MHTIKRDGTLVPFDATKIEKAIYTAFLKDADGVMRPGASEASTSIRDKVTAITALVVANLNRRSNDGTVHIEDIQDQVELALMRSGEHKVARDYVLYREKQAQQRLQQKQADQPEGLQERDFSIRRANGDEIYLTRDMILKNLGSACQRWDWQGNADLVMKSLVKLLFDGISEDEFVQAKIMATRPLIETDPMYAYTAGFFLLEKIRAEAFCQNPSDVFIGGSDYDANNYPANYFQDYIRKGVAIERLDKRLLDFDLDKMAEAIVPSRDLHFQYQGLQILYDRYLIHENGTRLELPQALWMRVAMGLAVNEIDREKWAIAFYNVLSTFRFVSSTPTLFNAGTTHPQLSSCYLTTVPDDLDGIFEAVKENALLSKFSGGLGNDWTPVRAMGSWIKGTNGKSQGVVPFLKVVNDTAVAVNQGGKRKGAVCAYLETWHLDIEEFLELRKNTGDDRRRTHDMNTANWIPDLFMKRVMDNAEWTLFSPNEVPDLHELYGTRFEERYAEYESMAENGQLEQFKKVPAVELWRKMLTMLFETGHPWITFKDPCNVRSPQRHAGVVHSSNLCVAPETLVLTDKGHLPISSLVNKTVKVWNGMMFSETTVHQTGVNQPLVEVRLDNGATLSCTSYHKFYIQNEYGIPAKEVRAGDLKAGDKLIKSEYPVIDDATWPDFPYAYTHGFFCGDGTYGNGRPRLSLYDVKKQLTPFLDIKAGTGVVDASGRLNFTLPFDLPEKYTVPMHFSLKSRVQWLAGLFDADGTVTKNGNASSIQIASIYPDFLESVRLMLQTVGVYSTVSLLAEQRKVSLPDGKGDSAMYDCKPIYRLMIAHNGLLMLNKLGFMPHRLKMPLTTTQRRAEHFVQVVEVKDNGRTDDTYCFSEPIRHMGVFNGILTGQCTEITLNSNDDETAVCNLGSVNLMQHLITNPVISEHGDDLETEDWPYDQLRESMTPVNALRHINKEALFETVGTAIRMLDNVIDINFYPTRKARNANMRHRAIGLGVMGFADALQALRIPMDSEAAVTFAGVSQEVISFAAIQTSADLAVARGSYSSFQGSDWSRGILPINTVQRLEIERGMELLTAQQPSAIDPDLWDAVRVRVQHGIRNSNIMAIAPTATISNIVGVSQGIDPIYQNLYVKSNLSGEFTVVNTQMVADMEKLDLWDDVMVNDLKYFDGSLAHIDRIPSWMKRLYATAFEIDPLWLVRMTAERQKWIDQSVSLNLYMAKPSGKALDNLYKQAWLYGLKTTYYLRTMGATSAEKSTVTEGTLNAVQGGTPAPAIKACLIDDPTCEACQ
ncbi:MAG: ribonucleoside-diphosphate reductase subunit alpha [Acidithiobacillus sp.]|nr:ribonucleoside-diphosphate reductase subunit alpha [Acidithiobacillus sp.]